MVSRQHDRNAIFVILGSLGWPLILGAAASSIFYVLIFQGPFNTPAMHRYFATHPVAFFATGMFFVGLAALLLKLFEVLGQYVSLSGIGLEKPPEAGQSVADCASLLDALDSLPAAARRSYLGRRLSDALEHVERKGSADGLDDELKYLADLDAARQQDSYALVRIIIWATPMLGFLGTVIGITQALGDLNPEELATSIQTAMEGLLAGLYVAFDTTALALSLSIVLMFVQFLIDRVETQLLAIVDARAGEELTGRFEQIGSATDPHLTSIERMGQSVIKASEQLVERQTMLWRETISAAHQQWSQLVQASGHQVQDALTGALDQSLQNHAAQMAKLEQAAAEHSRQRWEQWQTVLSDNARIMHAQQVELVRQGEIMTQAVQAAGDVIKLEHSLNNNLQALAGAKNFEDTVMSLSAAIHLLNARLGQSPEGARQIDLKAKGQGRAA